MSEKRGLLFALKTFTSAFIRQIKQRYIYSVQYIIHYLESSLYTRSNLKLAGSENSAINFTIEIDLIVCASR